MNILLIARSLTNEFILDLLSKEFDKTYIFTTNHLKDQYNKILRKINENKNIKIFFLNENIILFLIKLL